MFAKWVSMSQTLETVSHSVSTQWTSRKHRILLRQGSLYALSSLIKLMLFLVDCSFTLLVMHGTDMIIPGNSIFFSNIFPLNSLETDTGFLSGKSCFHSKSWELFWFSADRVGSSKRHRIIREI